MAPAQPYQFTFTAKARKERKGEPSFCLSDFRSLSGEWDLSLGCQYRPLHTDNIILSAGFGVLIPGSGWNDIYGTNTGSTPGYSRTGSATEFTYSGLIALTLTY